MAQQALSVNLDSEGRNASIDATSLSVLKQVIETYKVTYSSTLLFPDDLFVAIDSVVSSRRIPQVDTPYANDPALLAKTYSHEQLDDGRLIWRVFVTYKNASVSASLSGGGSPADEPWVVSWKAHPIRRFTQDAFEFKVPQDPADVFNDVGSSLVSQTNRTPIDNVLEDLFDPQAYDEYDMYGTFRKKLTSFSPNDPKKFIGKVNTDSTKIGGMTINPFQAKVISYDVSPKKNQDSVDFYPLTVVIGVRESTWALRLGNQGFRYKDLETEEIHGFATDGQNSQKPQWLNEDGTKDESARTRLYLKFIVENLTKIGDIDLPRELP